jgi:hypothetical protein
MNRLLLSATSGAVLLLSSQMALAHHADPVAEAVCDTETGLWNIKYKVTTWENCDGTNPPVASRNLGSCSNDQIGVFFYDNSTDADEFIEPDASSPGFLAEIGSFEASPDAMFMGEEVSPLQEAGDVVWIATKPLDKWNDDPPLSRRSYAALNPTLVIDYRSTSVEIPTEEVCEPPPPEVGCWFTGGKNIAINVERGRPEHTGGGNIYPSCSAEPGDGGQWNHIDHAQGLQFQADSLTVVRCFNAEGTPPGASSPMSSVNSIEAIATGTIKGIGRNGLEETPATAVMILEDWGEPGRKDKYTIDASAENGSASILLDRAALERGGNFQIHQSSCDN